MGLRESTPHLPLYSCHTNAETESALIHAEGFSQEILGDPVQVSDGGLLKKLSVLFCLLAVLLAALAFSGWRWLGWFRPDLPDEVTFTDPVILSAVKDAAQGGQITLELADTLTSLRLKELPESWDELTLLPALEQVELPQQALLDGGTLPEGDITVVLRGGDGK